MSEANTSDAANGESPREVPVLLQPREAPNQFVDSLDVLARCLDSLTAGTGPFALDVERAGGYRYTQRAYLVQVRRAGSGTWLIDPLEFDAFDDVAAVLSQNEWVLHAASQDLPSLKELGLNAPSLFDTELAGRLVGLERVGLAAMTERYLGYSLAKAHSAADWSTRPLPSDWLNYAALDVEPLLELRAALEEELAAKGRHDWALEEFEWARTCPPPPSRAELWRRVKGMTKRSPRALAIARELWLARDDIARQRDRAPSRVLPDRAIAAMAASPPTTLAGVRSIPQLRRHPDSQLAIWLAAVERARQLPASELPSPRPNAEGIPNHRYWDRINTVAASRLAKAREDLASLSDELQVPRENLISPANVRDAIWAVSGGSNAEAAIDPTSTDIANALRQSGARTWQVDLVAELVTASVAAADNAATRMDDASGEADITGQ